MLTEIKFIIQFIKKQVMIQIENLSLRSNFLYQVFICILCLSSIGIEAYAQPWTQLGQDIVGEADGDVFGSAVAINSDGNIIAVGAPANDGSGNTYAGQVVAYFWNGSSWAQMGNQINGSHFIERFGYAVSLDSVGNTLATTALGSSQPGIGHGRIYSWNGSDWTQKGNDIVGESIDDNNGQSVSLSADGNIVAIGANHNNDNGQYSGHVRVHSWDGTTWVQKGNDIDGEAIDDNSGKSVSLSSDGNTVAIGAQRNDGIGGDNVGHVRVYAWGGFDWVQKGIDIDGEENLDLSGFSVSIDALGNTLAIGAPGNNWTGDPILGNCGHLRIYSWNGSAWVQKGIDIDGFPDDQLGWTVSISSDGNTVTGGAQGNGDNFFNYKGYAKVYTWNGSVWAQTGTKIDQYSFGVTSINLSSNGNTLVLGIPVNIPTPVSSYAGMARAYQFDTTLGITNQNSNNTIVVFPNPTNGKFNVNGITGQLKIYNVLGELIYSQSKLEKETFIDISNQPNGLFFLNIIEYDRSTSVKVLIQK